MTATPPTILLAGGGSGGHLYPGVSVAEVLGKLLPEVRPIFLCTQRPIDADILEPTGYEYVPQPIVPPVRSVGGLLRFWNAWRATQDQVRTLIAERRPAAVLGLGGYAAGVAVKLASAANVPTAILNPDVVPGKANRYLMKFVRSVCCGFDATKQHVAKNQQAKLTTTGCPVRREVLQRPDRRAAAERLGLDCRLSTLVITGASQGAATVNEAVLELLIRLKRDGSTLQGWQVLHLAGKDHAEAVRLKYRDLALPARVIDFTPAMSDVWSVADLAVSRSGASSVAELTACGVPSILMPYPFHKDRHQTANAQVLADAGAAVLLDDLKNADQNAAALRPHVEGLLYDAPRRRTMAEAATKLARPDAADAVARVIEQLVAPAEAG
jgi:UDP-N-acetylglucosamine--N-acetylmuramyl-(pentapeptide) pyrophosphoryl-undecaprenol N-acetylglucosamine transferase